MSYGKYRVAFALLFVATAGVAARAAEEQSTSKRIDGSKNPAAIPFGSAVDEFAGIVVGMYEQDPNRAIQRVRAFDQTMDEATAKAFIEYLRKIKDSNKMAGREAMRNLCSRRSELVSYALIERAMKETSAALDVESDKVARGARAILGDGRMGMFERYVNTQIKTNMTIDSLEAWTIEKMPGENPQSVMVRMCDHKPVATGKLGEGV